MTRHHAPAPARLTTLTILTALAAAASLTGAGSPADAATGPFATTAVNAGSGFCMDEPGATTTVATQIIQWTCNGGANQTFTFTPVANTANTYTIGPEAAGECLDVSGNSTASGASVIQWDCNGQTNEQFTLTPVGSAYAVAVVNSGLCLSPAADSTANDTGLVQMPCTNAATRLWTLGGVPGTSTGPYNFGSGYSAINGTFTSVTASWTEPTAICRGGNQATGFWDGLSGNGTIAQTGTAANCDGTTPVYTAWWEMFPAGGIVYSDPVRPGDQISSSVTYNGNNVFTLVLTDTTEGWSERQTQTQQASGGTPTSANIIVEANTDTGVGSGNVTDFGSVTFTACAANGQPLSAFDLWTGNLRDANGVQEDTISPLTGNGESFTATWISTG